MKLVIVESPTKAKTIKKFLGRGFKVVSSYGHVRDLPKSDMGIDVENSFIPRYVIPTKARKRVNELKKDATKADNVILATDEDREGEAIAWHLVQALGLEQPTTDNLKPSASNIERIVFHEITKEAIKEALKNPRAIDLKLVDAQQARRMLDRLVGYELSPFLWRKIYRGLSAGRVQSVAVRLVVEREREIQAFKPQEYWTIEGLFATNKKEELKSKLHAKDGKALNKFAIPSEKEAAPLIEKLKQASYTVRSVTGKQSKKKAPSPFTTSLLQQEASSRLNMSPRQTMMIAQQLYEGVSLGKGGAVGLITYMRTDSMNLADKFLAETQTFLKQQFGNKYAMETPRRHKSKSKNAQEAHEAIRPTDVNCAPKSVADALDAKQLKLYTLIWQRSVASQMPEAEIQTTTIDIDTVVSPDASVGASAAGTSYTFRATGSIVTFDGWRKVYPTNANETVLPEIKEKEAMILREVAPTQHFTEPPPRYTDATLIKVLEEHGIGRPSTYAPTIGTIMDRGYVERIERRLRPTDLSYLVNDLLVEHFPEIVNYEFTAKLEEELDDIAMGKKHMTPVLKAFYEPFKKHLEETDAKVSRENISEEKTDEVCEKCGQPMIIKLGRYGKFLACTGFPDCKNTKPIDGEEAAPQKIDEKCDKCGQAMEMKRGRFGPFIGCSGYPDCKNIKKIEKKTGVTCPKCGKGDIVEKRSRKGKMFYSCNRYPDCEFALWSKPTGEQCPNCQALLVAGAKGTIACSSKECKFSKQAEDKNEQQEAHL